MASRAEATSRVLAVRKTVLPLFLISGATGLIYEVAWTRSFGVVFGNTVFAVSTVLTAFMLGLAMGSWLFGKLADRCSQPLTLYALLELGIGAYAILFTTVLSATDVFYSWFFRSFHPSFYTLSLVRFILSILILFLPTALMGGTLPVLSKLWAGTPSERVSESTIGQSVGLLYAVNTFGAVAGTFLCGYFFLRLLGVSNTIYLAGSANIVVGVVALALSRFAHHWQMGMSRVNAAGSGSPQPLKKGLKRSRGEVRRGRSETRAARDVAGKRVIVLVAVGLAGFCALALEVLWTRVLVFVLETTAYAFACMLTTFLLGIALGSLLCSRLLLKRIRNLVFSLGAVEMLVGLSSLASVLLLGKLWHIDYVLIWKLRASGFWRAVLAHFIDSSIVLLVPTMLMGAAFPIAVKVCAQSWNKAGSRVGEVYASNTLGAVIGSFAAGFVMVPLLGLRNSFLLVVAILLFVALFLISFSERSRAALRIPAAVFSLSVVVVSIFSIPRDVFVRTMNTYHYPSKIVYIKDDATGTITVHDLPDGDRLIAVDGVNVAGVDLMLRTTQKLQGYVPLLVHDNPQKVLQIGFGSGETSGVGLAFGVDEYNIVEICPGVFEAGRFFEEINRGSYRDPRLNKIIMDGKNFVKLTDEKFDVIMNDSTYPGTTGSSALYTYDHFRECRKHLKPGGVLSCWVPLDLRPRDFRMIVRSFQTVMPHSSFWMANNCLNKHAVLLGAVSPLRIDFQQVKRLVERPDISSDLARINIDSIYDLLDCFVVDEHGLRRIGRGVPLNTDDKPLLEFGAAIKRNLDDCFFWVLQQLSDNHSPVLPYLVNLGENQEDAQQAKTMLSQYFSGTSHALRGLLAMLEFRPDVMKRQFETAQKLNPHDRDVESCLGELRSEIKALAEAVERMPRNDTLKYRLDRKYYLLSGRSLAWGVDRGSTHFNLGEVHGELGNFGASSRSYEKALPRSHGSRKAHICNRLAWAYFRQKEYQQALDALDKAIELSSSEPDLQNVLRQRRQDVMRAAAESKP